MLAASDTLLPGEPGPPSPEQTNLAKRVRRVVIGGARDPNDPHMFHRLSLVAFFAWVGLGADGMSSSCYGPAEVFQVLHEYPHLSLLIGLATAFTIVVIVASYNQIIRLFPTGGGGYLVASHLLSPTVGMVSGCALLIDYVLTISLSLASGGDALFSFLDPSWHKYKLAVVVLTLVVLTIMNLRGVKESVAPLLPIFLFFVFSHIFAILYAIFADIGRVGDIVAQAGGDFHDASSKFGIFGLLFLMARAYSMGAGTYTGIEAVSNGLPILRDPKVRTGQRTMLYMAASLIFMVLGLIIAYTLTDSHPVENKTLNAVMLGNITAHWGKIGPVFVFLTLLSEAAILFVAAQTGFLDGPRVLANMALDRWLPTRFASLSDRLVTQNGVMLMGGAALATLLLSGGSVEYLLVLYSITVFITFVLSQLGMCRYWLSHRKTGTRWKMGFIVNGIGLLLTSSILIGTVVIKIRGGGWITLLVTGSLVFLAVMVRRHYNKTLELLKRLDVLVQSVKAETGPDPSGEVPQPPFDKSGKTAVILVNGFNGLGLHTLFNVIRLFRASFKNFVFLQVGVVDAGNFKGVDEIGRLQDYVATDLNQYVSFIRRQGSYADALGVLGTDVVEEILKAVPQITEKYGDTVIFAGQLVFPEDTFFTRVLHNYLVFTAQRKLYNRGVPFMVLPIRV